MSRCSVRFVLLLRVLVEPTRLYHVSRRRQTRRRVRPTSALVEGSATFSCCWSWSLSSYRLLLCCWTDQPRCCCWRNLYWSTTAWPWRRFVRCLSTRLRQVCLPSPRCCSNCCSASPGDAECSASPPPTGGH